MDSKKKKEKKADHIQHNTFRLTFGSKEFQFSIQC